jgi:hypothetical protein
MNTDISRLPKESCTKALMAQHLSEGEEVWGLLGPIVRVDPDTVSAIIGSRTVLLPVNLDLSPGQVFVARFGDDHFVWRAVA